MVKYKSFELTYELPRAITEWIGGQHKDMGESGGKQVIMGAAGTVAQQVGHAAQGAATRGTIQNEGDKTPKKPGGDQSGTETPVNPKTPPTGDTAKENKATPTTEDNKK